VRRLLQPLKNRNQRVARAQQHQTRTDRSGKLVADAHWDRRLVALQPKNSSAVAIGNKVGAPAKTFINRLYELRKPLGTSIGVPENQWRGKGKEKLGYPG